ncbi:MAG: hypothetical protein AB7H53_19380 [Hyphomicrobium sp.]
MIEAPVRSFHRNKAEKEKETTQDRASRRTANATVWIASFTATTLIIGTLQWCTLHSTDEAIHTQLDQMRAEQRAWLALNILTARLDIFRGQNPRIDFEIAVSNVGKTPAREIITPAPTILDSSITGDYSKSILETCPRQSPPFDIGTFLVPGDRHVSTPPLLFTKAQVDKAWSAPDQPGDVFKVTVVVCASYKTIMDERIHIMGAVVQIRKRTEGGNPEFSIEAKYGD